MKKILSKLKFIVKKEIHIFKYKKYKKRCNKEKKKEFLIFNTPIHGNIGDHAIIYAELKILKEKNILAYEIPTYYEKYCFDYIKKHVSEDAIIGITGGGFIGSQWMVEEDLVNKVVSTFKNYPIIIFPATFYFKNDSLGREELEKSKKIFSQAKDLTIFAREEKTYEFICKEYKNAKSYLVPDIVLSLKENFNEERNDILLCLRDDVEGKLNKNIKTEIYDIAKKYGSVKLIDTVEKYSIPIKNRDIQVKNKIKEFAKAKLVITDRLHGMIFASITGTPCVVLGNYNYKVEGVYQWIKEVDKNILFEKDIENINEDINNLLTQKMKQDENKEYNFKQLYDTLENIVKK